MLWHAILTRIIRQGTLTVQYPSGQIRHYGNGEAPRAGMLLRTPRAERRLVLNPSLAFGELYMDGELEPLDCSFYDLLDVMVINAWSEHRHPMEHLTSGLRRLRRPIDQLNLAGRARRNVAHHYDLNGRLYALFLDRDRQYSCAYFPTGTETLEEAQAAKKRHIAAKLKLDRPDGARRWRWSTSAAAGAAWRSAWRGTGAPGSPASPSARSSLPLPGSGRRRRGWPTGCGSSCWTTAPCRACCGAGWTGWFRSACSSMSGLTTTAPSSGSSARS